ncbi:hypothetical protein [Haloarchaeobius iranensis]|uniref:Uncharacterized protein n=1 Tax=Haloarchaeobius iranensis TaxID=996166 RepID=A0A1H0BDN5_9EURY|nr:hypothetical protein [Haloarchaeobius iranensis]SDN43715.1 hypothetical protein SAMN05192554_1386 [Haloarchaeobius iranensis]
MAWLHPITISAGLSGLIAASVTLLLYSRVFSSEPLPSTRFLMRLRDTDQPPYEVGGTIVYVAYGGLVGAVYPWTFRGLLGLAGSWITILPNTLLTGLVFGGLLLGPWAGLRAFGLLEPPLSPGTGFDTEQDERKYLTMVGFHVVYGLGLGVLVGLSETLWYPFLGA